jgi:hypothetical protein
VALVRKGILIPERAVGVKPCVTSVGNQFGIHSHRAWVSLYIIGLDRGNSLPRKEGHSPSYSGGSTSDGTGKERDSC